MLAVPRGPDFDLRHQRPNPRDQRTHCNRLAGLDDDLEDALDI